MFVCTRQPYGFYVFMSATVGIYGYFYYVDLVCNSNNCQIKGLQQIFKFAICISAVNKKSVVYRHIVSLKQN